MPYCYKCGNILEEGDLFCHKCGNRSKEQYSGVNNNVNVQQNMVNNLPSGNDPNQIGKLGSWNWGAFGFGWIWASVNANAATAALLFLLGCIPIVNIITAIVMGIKGNDLTWENRSYSSVQEFHRIQKGWGTALAILWIFSFFIFFIAAASNS